jgi:hypothetical protein
MAGGDGVQSFVKLSQEPEIGLMQAAKDERDTDAYGLRPT